MSGLKKGRGRPKRNNIKVLQQHQINESHATCASILPIDVKQPLNIYRTAATRPEEKVEELQERDNSAATTTTVEEEEVSQGVQLSSLPKVGFTQQKTTNIMDENNGDMDNDEQRLQEQQLLHQHYGDNMLSPYKRPENHYIHHIEPSDVELYDSVEYDMDEQDKVWLQLYNQERSKELLGDISPFLFETIMDKLEKEWFHLIKDAPKPSEPQVTLPEDSACAVCDDTEVENSNAIVFCDGCNVAVHQDCYGIPYIPEGQWLCRKCMISPEFPVSCLFCPNEGGAFKQTNTNQWGHLLCAIWIPEIGVSNTIYMEPIDMIENVPKSRWKLTCFICRKKQGACIQCDNKHCFSAFHVTCAKSARLCMKMTTHSSEGVVLKAYCDKHTPKEHNHVLDVPPVLRGRGRGRGRANSSSSSSSAGLTRDQFNNNKVARAHQHHYTTGAPIPPDSILVKIDNLPCVRTSSIRKRAHVVTAIAHYWSLKRESRRGAPLLKRLHLEPWTASSKYTTDENDYYLRKSVIVQLRADLDRVRILSEQVQKRERQKLDRTKKQKMYIDMILYPLEYVLRPILTQFMEIDRKKVFLNHVTAEEAPDYSSVIEKSMCFSEIYGKLSLHRYTHLSQFKEDVSLIWENSMQYNKTDTSFYKVAIKLKTASEKLFAVAEEKMSRYELNGGMWDVPVDETLFDYKAIVEEEEEEDVDVEELSQDSPQETAVVKSSEPIAPREPKYRRKKKFHQANPRLLNSLRKRNVVPVKPEEKAPEESTDQNAVTEANVQSLNIQGSQPSNTSTTLATALPTVTTTATATATATTTAPSSNELQQSSTSYFAEQRRKEQQRKEEREKKRIAEELEKQRLAQEEEQRALAEKEQDLKLKREKRNVYERERRARKKLQLQGALNEDKQTSPPAEIIQYDIETMQPIYVPRPPTPPPAAAAAAPAAASVENPTTTDMEMDAVTDMKVDTTTTADITVVNTEAAPSQPQPPALFPIMAPLPPSHSEPSQPAEANTSVSTEVNTSASTTEPIATATTSVEVKVEAASSSSSSSSQKVGKKRKAPSAPIPRKTRSAGLKASIEELTKRPKISHEARTLFASYNGVSHLERPTEVYKEDRNKSAPVGWVYLEEDDDEDESATTTTTTTTTATLATTADHRVTIEPAAPSAAEEVKSQKYVKRKRNDIPVPNFKRGEIVWAQVTGYPSHPAKFLNLPDDQCSPNILKSRRYQGDVLVEFLCVPENHKWGWVRRSSICEVGDLEEDKKRLSESLAKKPKRNVFIQEAKEGYRHAGQILGLDPEPAIEAVFNQVVEKKKKKAGKRSS